MATLSGIDGTVLVGATEQTEVTKWTFETTVAVPKHASNSTAGFRKAHVGAKDSKGTIEMKYDDTTALPWGVGDSVTLILRPDKNSTADQITVPAIISGGTTECDIDGDGIVSVTFPFEGNGAWTGIGMYANI